MLAVSWTTPGLRVQVRLVVASNIAAVTWPVRAVRYVLRAANGEISASVVEVEDGGVVCGELDGGVCFECIVAEPLQPEMANAKNEMTANRDNLFGDSLEPPHEPPSMACKPESFHDFYLDRDCSWASRD